MLKPLLLCAAVLLAGCAVQGEPVRHKIGTKTMEINAEVNGSSLTAVVYADGQPVITHRYPPFVNSRDEKTTQYRGHNIRSVLKIIKGIGSTNAQVYVYVDDGEAIPFYF